MQAHRNLFKQNAQSLSSYDIKNVLHTRRLSATFPGACIAQSVQKPVDRNSIPGRANYGVFSLRHRCGQTGSVAHTASHPLGKEASFTAGIVARAWSWQHTSI